MGNMSKTLLDMLAEFMICEVGSKALDGITYTMILKTSKDQQLYDRYMKIKTEALNCGYNDTELFRVYELSNGFIFDMDISTAKQIIAEMNKAVEQSGGETPYTLDILNEMPDKRRKNDMKNLARYLKQEYDKGKNQVELALFSKNATNRIMINGKSHGGENLMICYNAYAIRHWDIELVNEKLLIPAGFRVSRIQPCEILPSKTGVSFIFTLESTEGLI